MNAFKNGLVCQREMKCQYIKINKQTSMRLNVLHMKYALCSDQSCHICWLLSYDLNFYKIKIRLSTE